MKNHQELGKLKEEIDDMKNKINIKEGQHLDEMKKMENVLKEEMNSKEGHHLDEMKLLKQKMNSKEARHLEEIKILKKNMKSIDSKYTTELNTLKYDIKTIKSILGSIQVRNLAKNFLNRYSIHLTDEDKKNMSKRKKRWALIAERGIEHLKDFCEDCIGTNEFKSQKKKKIKSKNN